MLHKNLILKKKVFFYNDELNIQKIELNKRDTYKLSLQKDKKIKGYYLV